MRKILMIVVLFGVFCTAFAQGKSKAELEALGFDVTIKLKPPKEKSELKGGNVALITLKNTKDASVELSFIVIEYMNGVVKLESEKMQNCFGPGKSNKYKIYLQNWTADEGYEWIFSDMVYNTLVEACPKK